MSFTCCFSLCCLNISIIILGFWNKSLSLCNRRLSNEIATLQLALIGHVAGNHNCTPDCAVKQLLQKDEK